MSGREGDRPDEVIEHGPVTLRRYREDDLDALLEAVTESLGHLRPWMPWAADYSRESAREFLAGSIKRWDEGTEYNYAITTAGALAGGVGLMPGSARAAWRSATGCAARTPAAAWPPRRRRRWWSRRSGCPAWTGWRSCTTS